MTKALQERPIDTLKAIVQSPSVQEQFKNAMGKHSDLFVASLIDVFNSGLQDCVPATVVQEALKAAVLKLPISKGLGFAYLVPYQKSSKVGGAWVKTKEAQFQIGYKGLIQLAMRSGQLKALNGGPVFDGEFKEYNRMTGELDISGKPKSEEVTGYFVYMELINGFRKSEYWTKERVIAHAKEKSQSYKNQKSAWTTDFDAMATKTVLKSVISKYAPMSIEFIGALSAEDTTSEEEIDVAELAGVPDKKPKQRTKKPVEDKEGNEIIDAEIVDDGPGY